MSPTTAIASRRPAHATGPSISAGRYVYVTTIQTSGRAGNNAASRAKMITRITRLPTGPSDPNSAVRSSSREAIGGPHMSPPEGINPHLLEAGRAFVWVVLFHAYQAACAASP